VSAAAATRHPENKNASTATITIEYRDFISHLHVKHQTNHDHETDFVIIKRIGQDWLPACGLQDAIVYP
jgi:hypothetical protein